MPPLHAPPGYEHADALGGTLQSIAAAKAGILKAGRPVVVSRQQHPEALQVVRQQAAALGCDGVHIGQEDARYAVARRLMGKDRIVGVTCHDSRHLAMEAAEEGADYVAFGAFFPTDTKDPKASTEPEILSIWQETMSTPCVAIGGITVGTARLLTAAGADFLAVSAGVWNHPDGPAAAGAAFNAEMAAGMAERPPIG